MLRQTQGDNYYQKMDNKIKIVDLGYMDYQSAWDYQKDYHQKVIMGKEPDTLLLGEHEPV